MDVDSQVEEFDSSSSESGSSSASEDEERRSEEDEPSELSGDEGAALEEVHGSNKWAGAKPKGSRKRRRDRKRHAAGMRKKLRTHYESVEDFNPEARSAQSAELERIRRLELQQSIMSPPTHTPPLVTHHRTPPPNMSLPDAHKEGSHSPEMVVVDLSHKTTPPADTIVIDSGSDSDSTEKGNPPAAKPEGHSSGRAEALHRKYDDPTVPRQDGKLIVNVNHPSNEPDVFLAPQVARIVKPHQIGGIRFLYDNIIESVSRYTTSPGFGCILAHSMGLGKTLQVISFIDIFMRYTPAKHALCVVPVNTLQNWINEFDRWLPMLPANQNPSSSHMTGFSLCDTQYRTFGVFLLSESSRNMEARVKVISEWQEMGGVLLIGYEMFRLLSLSVPSLAGNKMAVKRRKNTPAKNVTGTIDLDETEKEMDALIGIQKALCNPGPDLVVCDEGHRIKNDITNISQALKRIRTRRRIVMTGYPLQNNLTEYWCMVDFVRPKYLGTKQEFADLFERPITNGQCADSTPNDVRLMRYRSHVLHSLLEGFVLRRGHEILKSTLPPKFEHVLFLRPSEAQGILYNYNMSLIQQGGGVSASTGPLKAFAVCTKIWNHPDIYHNEVMAQTKDPSLTNLLDDAGLSKSAIPGLKVSGGESSCKLDWPHPQLPSYQSGRLENSPKMAVLMELIDKSVHFGDKILVFSQSLSTLSYVEKLLSQRPVPIPDAGLLSGNMTVQYQNVTWTKNKNFCRIDGSTNSLERDKLINGFNSPANKDCWVFLLSTKAGCLGINLIGANRVVVLDVSWNPCYDAQAVCRVYRYGQTKPCYIYRMVCDGTMERKIYDRQISKQGMSDRVVDHLQPERHLSTQDIISLISPLTTLPPSRDLSPFAQEYLFDPLLMNLCYSQGQLLTKLPFKHESLLMDSADERMTDVEKYLALRGFQDEWKALKSGPASLHEYRAMQGKQAAAMSSTPAHMATPHVAPPPSLTGHSPNQMGKPFSAPVIKNPNQPIEVICLDSDEEEQKSTTPPKPPPPPPQVTFEPVTTVSPNLSTILSSRAQSHFTASHVPIQQTPSPTHPQPLPPMTSSDPAMLSVLLKTPTTLEPSVTRTQLTELSEGIVDSLKSQLLTTSLTRYQQDQSKMATVEQLKRSSETSPECNEQLHGEAVQGVPAVTNSAESAIGHTSTEHLQEGSAQTVLSEKLGPTDETNVHLNSNTNNAMEENHSLYPQGKYVTVTTPTTTLEGEFPGATVTLGGSGEWKIQSEKCRKASKKDHFSSPSSWSPPPPPPPPSTNYTPCSIPLLSPIAAKLLFMSTGTQLPSSPPEDVSKYPPIISPTPSSPGSSQDDGMDWEYLEDTPLTIEEDNTAGKSAMKEGPRVAPPTTSGHQPSSERSRDNFDHRSLPFNSMSSSVGVVSFTTEKAARNERCTVTSTIVHPMLCSPLPLGQSSVATTKVQSASGGVEGSAKTVDASGSLTTKTVPSSVDVGTVSTLLGSSVGYNSQTAVSYSKNVQFDSKNVEFDSKNIESDSKNVDQCSPTSVTAGHSGTAVTVSEKSSDGMAILTELLDHLPPSLSLCSQPVLPSSQPLSMPSTMSTSQPLSMPSTMSAFQPLSMPSNVSTSQPLSMPSTVSTSQPLSMPSTVSTSQPLSMPSNVLMSQPLSMPSTVSSQQHSVTQPYPNFASTGRSKPVNPISHFLHPAALTTPSQPGSSATSSSHTPPNQLTTLAYQGGVLRSLPGAPVCTTPERNVAGRQEGLIPSSTSEWPSIIADSAKTRHEKEIVQVEQSLFKESNMISKKDHQTTRNHPKPKWIRSFSESEMPPRGRVSSAGLPSPSMYDPQPIVCIDNWAKSGGDSIDSTTPKTGPTASQATRNTNKDIHHSSLNTPSYGEAAMSESCGQQEHSSRPLTLKTREGRQSSLSNTHHHRSLSTSAIEGVHPSVSTPPPTRSRLVSPTSGVMLPSHNISPSLFGLDFDNRVDLAAQPPTSSAPHHPLSNAHIPTSSTPHRSSVTAQLLSPHSASPRDTFKPSPTGTKPSLSNHVKPQLPRKQTSGNVGVDIHMYDSVPGHVTMLPLPGDGSRDGSGPNHQPAKLPGTGSDGRPSVPLNGSGSRSSSYSSSSEHLSGQFDLNKFLSASSSESPLVSNHRGTPGSQHVLSSGSGSARADTPTSRDRGIPWASNRIFSSSSPVPTDRERFRFPGELGQGEACVMTSGLQQLTRTKKTAVVSPYCVAKSHTTPPVVAHSNKRCSERLPVVVTRPNQSQLPGCLSPSAEKLMASVRPQMAPPNQCAEDSVQFSSKQLYGGMNLQGTAQPGAVVNGDFLCDVQTSKNRPSNLTLNTPLWNGISPQQQSLQNGNAIIRNQKPKDSVSTDSFLRAQLSGQLAKHSSMMTTPTRTSSPLLCASRNSPHPPSDNKMSDKMSDKNNQFNFPLPSKNAVPNLPVRSLNSPGVIQEEIWTNSVRDTSSPSGHSILRGTNGVGRASCSPAQRASPINQRACHGGVSATPLSLRKPASDASLHATPPQSLQPPTSAMAQSGVSAFSSLRHQRVTENSLHQRSSSQQRSADTPQPSLPNWVEPSRLTEPSPLGAYVSASEQQSPKLPGISPSSRLVGNSPIHGTMGIGHARTTSPAHHLSPPAASPASKGLGISPSHTHLQSAVSPCHSGTSPVNCVGGNTMGNSPSHSGQPNLFRASPSLRLDSCLPNQNQPGIAPRPTHQLSSPLHNRSPSLPADQSFSANHVSADSAARGTPPLHFRPVPTGHAQSLGCSPVTPTSLSPVSTNFQGRPRGQSTPPQQASYAIPSLYGRTGPSLTSSSSVRQLLSPTHSQTAQLPSFDQIRSSSQHGYSGCQSNCRVGIATRMCK